MLVLSLLLDIVAWNCMIFVVALVLGIVVVAVVVAADCSWAVSTVGDFLAGFDPASAIADFDFADSCNLAFLIRIVTPGK